MCAMTVQEKLDRAEALARKAQDYMDVCNCAAALFHYQRLRRPRAALAAIWSKRGDIAWCDKRGRAQVEAYCENMEKVLAAKLAMVSALFPEVENKPENLGVGDLEAQGIGNPYVVIAGDGQTAQGVFLAVGESVECGTDGAPRPRYVQYRLGIDFIREADGWKIWHVNRYPDFASPLPAELFLEKESKGRTFSFPTDGEHRHEEKPHKRTPPYAVTKVPKAQPELPQPYGTWSDDLAFPAAD